MELSFSKYQSDFSVDESGLSADSTTVNRLQHGGVAPGYREEYIRVQAVVGPHWAPLLAGPLQRIVGAGLTIKWRNPAVQNLLLRGSGDLANRLRRQIEQVPLVVVDPMEPVRHMDRLVLDDGAGGPIWSHLLCGTPNGQSYPASAVESVRRYTTEMVLSASGVGDLDRLLSEAALDDIDDWDERRADLVATYAANVGHNHRASAKLALQSTALFVRDCVPDSQYNNGSWQDETRYVGGMASHHARSQLRDVARVRLEFDEGEEATTAVARLRDTAEVLGGHAPRLPAERGFVRSIDDGQSICVQIADVVSGYASARIASEGITGVVRRFGILSVNNRRLTDAEAESLDRDRAWHRRLFA